MQTVLSKPLLGLPHRISVPVRVSSTGRQSDGRTTLNTLDSLLGVTDAPQQEPKPSRPWWSIPPTQSAPARQTTLAPGNTGRFINEDFLRNELRVGRVTAVGQEVDIPKVDPFFSYLALTVNLVVYGVGTFLALRYGEEVSREFAATLALNQVEVLQHGEYWRLLSSLTLNSGLVHLAVNGWALGALGPEVEAVMGSLVFVALYVLTGVSGSLAGLVFGDPICVGASAPVFGLLGAVLSYQLRNASLLKQEEVRQRTWMVVGVAGANFLVGLDPTSLVENAAHLGAFVAGAWLGYYVGPKYEVIREVCIPDGSMIVPEDAEEVTVVVDQHTMLDKGLRTAGFVGFLGALTLLAATWRS